MTRFRARTFGHKMLQLIYRSYLASGPRECDRPRSTAEFAYHVGRYAKGGDLEPYGRPGSPAYAAWAAGVDTRRRKAQKSLAASRRGD